MYSPRRMLISAFVCLITAIILAQYTLPLSRWAKGLAHKAAVQTATAAPLKGSFTTISTLQTARNMTRTPVYFLSHGGPNIMEDFQHPAYKKLQEIGREITQKVQPKGVVVFSAHWQAGPSTIQVNTAEITKLIYE